MADPTQHHQTVDDVELVFTHDVTGLFSLAFEGGTVPDAKSFIQGLQAALADVEGQEGDRKRKEQLTRDRMERLTWLRADLKAYEDLEDKPKGEDGEPLPYQASKQEELNHLTELEKTNEL